MTTKAFQVLDTSALVTRLSKSILKY